MNLDELTPEQLETITKNWKNAIAPNKCNGQCNLIEGGGELKCYGCGWIDCEIINN